jgi:hypothetical protein
MSLQVSLYYILHVKIHYTIKASSPSTTSNETGLYDHQHFSPKNQFHIEGIKFGLRVSTAATEINGKKICFLLITRYITKHSTIARKDGGQSRKDGG